MLCPGYGTLIVEQKLTFNRGPGTAYGSVWHLDIRRGSVWSEFAEATDLYVLTCSLPFLSLGPRSLMCSAPVSADTSKPSEVTPP